ncbi:hypothetical protein BJX68DRAFT_263169 [Aspergillus pseudodeflectus]|uniref:Uncharacterized protein n=1 Tax=Aspergillus pseudodeflectus TaxID=176178 RepID=A0ABR4L276_9EURO
MVSGGYGEQLARIKRVVLFACPTNGAEFALSLRRCILRGHPQEGQLRPLNDYINSTQRRVMRQIVNADGVSPHACHVPFMVFAGESDNLVVPAAAQSLFPSFGTLPGDHFSIVRPDSLQHRSYTALKHEIYLAYHGPPVPPVPSPIPPAPPPPPVILSIGLDGYFIGGDHKVATDAVFALLDTDAA